MDLLDFAWKAGGLIAALAAVISVLKNSLSHLQKDLEKLADKIAADNLSLKEQIGQMAKDNAATSSEFRNSLSDIKTATELNKQRIEKLENEVERMRPRVHALECTWGRIDETLQSILKRLP